MPPNGGCRNCQRQIERIKQNKNPFTNDGTLCCDSGGCGLVRQQFALDINLDLEKPKVKTIYKPNGFRPACVPGQSSSSQIFPFPRPGLTFPFGTIIATNFGDKTFSFTLVGADGENHTTLSVSPGEQVAVSGNIRRVDIHVPSSPIIGKFDFNLFLLPPDLV